MRKYASIEIGAKFSRWTIIKETDRNVISKNRMVIAKCKCGTEAVVRFADIYAGRSKGCGCFNTERVTSHGCTHSPFYYTWKGMIGRCYHTNVKSYRWYGKKGIRVCDEWHDVAVFIKWAETSGYKRGLTLERKDSKGDYCPDNCTWATYKEQNNNRSSNKILECYGMKKTISQWGDHTGINRRTISARLRRGWSLKKALNSPLLGNGRRGGVV